MPDVRRFKPKTCPTHGEYVPDDTLVGCPECAAEPLSPFRRQRLYRAIARRLRGDPDAYPVRLAAIEMALEARAEWHRQIAAEARRLIERARAQGADEVGS